MEFIVGIPRTPSARPNMAKQLYDAPRGTIFKFDPKQIKVVGIDTPPDPGHPLFDQRAVDWVGRAQHPKFMLVWKGYYETESPPIKSALAAELGLDENLLEEMIRQIQMIRSIRRDGILQPIRVIKDGDDAILVSGRSRLLSARWLSENEKIDIRVPGLPVDGDEVDQIRMVVAENEARSSDSAINRGRKAKIMLARGLDMAEIAREFAADPKTIEGFIALANSPQSIQKAVESGKIPATSAIRVVTSSLAKKDQENAVREMIDSGETSAPAASAHVRHSVRAQRGSGDIEDGAIVPPGHRQLRFLVEYADKHPGNIPAEAVKAFQWVLGDKPARHVRGATKALAEFEKEAAKKETKKAERAQKKAEREAKKSDKEAKKAEREAKKAAREIKTSKRAKGSGKRSKNDAQFEQGSINVPDHGQAPKKRGR